MENINTALLTRYLEAQDTIKQLLNEKQMYQDKINDLTIRLRSTKPNKPLVDAYYCNMLTPERCAKMLGILSSTFRRDCLQREQNEIRTLIQEKQNSDEDISYLQERLAWLEEEIPRAEKEERHDLYTGM